MKFRKIVVVDSCGLTLPELEKIRAYSAEPMEVYEDTPATEEEISARIGTADCVLVSWRTALTGSILKKAGSLRYIGMCCSLYDRKAANVDISAAEESGVTVKGVRDYGDEGTLEFVFSQLISLFKGYSKYKWRPQTQELKGKSIGIVGMGTLGLMVARTALHFGMEVAYFSRTRKPQIEKENISYMPLEELAAHCDVITTHLPKHTVLLTEQIFAQKKQNSVFINTSLGLTFEKDALEKWLKRDPSSFAIFDMEGAGNYIKELQETENVIVYPFTSGFTVEAKERLSVKVLENIEVFFRGSHI